MIADVLRHAPDTIASVPRYDVSLDEKVSPRVRSLNVTVLAVTASSNSYSVPPEDVSAA